MNDKRTGMSSVSVPHLFFVCNPVYILWCFGGSVEFGAAFELMKRHRINMNLMFDHNPVSFYANVDTFVRQLDIPANVNLFLSDLRWQRYSLEHYVYSCSFVYVFNYLFLLFY